MRLCMREAIAAEHMRELVVQPVAGGKRHSREPGGGKALAAGFQPLTLVLAAVGAYPVLLARRRASPILTAPKDADGR